MKNAKIESNGCRMEVVQDYAGVTLYFDGDYSPPSSERRPTEDEFHAAHGVITKHLNSVGKATENPDPAVERSAGSASEPANNKDERFDDNHAFRLRYDSARRP